MTVKFNITKNPSISLFSIIVKDVYGHMPYQKRKPNQNITTKLLLKDNQIF